MNLQTPGANDSHFVEYHGTGIFLRISQTPYIAQMDDIFLRNMQIDMVNYLWQGPGPKSSLQCTLVRICFSIRATNRSVVKPFVTVGAWVTAGTQSSTLDPYLK